MVESAALEKLMPAGFRLEQRKRQSINLTLLDDYDWAIWSAGLMLLRTAERKLVLQNHKGELIASDGAAESARFWWELPPGELATKLAKTVDLRAFVTKCSVDKEEQNFAILNEDDKTVSRLQLMQLNIAEQGECQLMSLQALRGYEAETEVIASALQGLATVDTPPLTVSEQLLQAGLRVIKPVSKPSFALQSDEAAEPALTRMISLLLDIARSQEPGLLDDIDSEFVHQYRVNIRKARSLVSLFKKLFSPDRYRVLNNALKSLGKRTNDLRDLDVFLLDYATYQQMLPENLHPGLKQLAERLRRRRRTAFNKVSKELQDDAYVAQVDTLANVLAQEPDFATARAQCPIKELVANKIVKQYRTIVKDGAMIDDNTPDEAVHGLRIECKKLRYLLELFAELFTVADIKKLIKQLKLLQDNLGRFNDFAVQREFLGQLADIRQISTEQLATINGLQAVLFDRQRQERGYVVANISHFSSGDMQSVFRETFSISRQEPDQG